MKIPSSEELKKQIMTTIDVSWRNGLQLSTIDSWLKNFTGEALEDIDIEQNLALWLLYNFTYFNEEEIKHLCKLMLRKYLHTVLKGAEKVDINEITNILKKSRFIPLGRYSESGAYVLYLFRQENDLPVDFFEIGNEICNGQKVVCIDDMTLSGNQALKKICKIKYDGYELKEDEIRQEFIDELTLKKEKELTNYLNKNLNCDKKDKKALAETMTARVIKNKKFYQYTKMYFIEHQFDTNLKNLVNAYTTGEIENAALYKMNRLLLEHYYKNELETGVNNIDFKDYYLLSFIASERAKQRLSKENINVINCIDVDETSEVFSESSIVFGDYVEERKLCEKMCRFYGKKLKPQYPLGYDNCQYLFGLYYTIPNNTLPIFWAGDNWNPLFIRHEKNYGGKVNDGFGKYV